MILIALAVAFALAVLFAHPAHAAAEPEAGAGGKRVALVVGNHLYKNVAPLKNAVNDSDAIADALAELGFEVISASDVDLGTFRKALDQFEETAEGAEAAVFYYSGHGFQLSGVNYLVPVDAKLKDRAAIRQETLRLDDIIKRLQARNRQTLVFLDACRNNPLPEKLRDKEDEGGLAQIETGTGTFVAFATQPGNIALDGAGDHSYFTDALLKNLDEPGISISDMMIRVRNEVEESTLHRQTPWDQSSLRSQFYFNPQEEESAALTDEDRELLKALDPELRKKFESRFGIQIDEAFANHDAGGTTDDAEQVASLTPNLRINDVGADAAPAAAKPEPVASAETAPAGPNLKIIDAEVDDAPVATDAPSLAETEPVFPDEQSAPATVAVAPVEADRSDAAPAAPDVVPSVLTEARPVDLAKAVPAGDATSNPAAAAAAPVETAMLLPSDSGARLAPSTLTPSTLAPATLAPSTLAPSGTGPASAAGTGPALALKPVLDGVRSVGPRDAARIVGTEVLPQAPSTPATPETKVAALEQPGKTDLVAPQVAVPTNPIPLAEDADGADRERDVARAIQSELTRLGCYRSGIDGEWGASSAKGLLRYFATKKEAPDNLEPNEALLSRLTNEDNVVCERTETVNPAVKPKAKTQTVSTKKPTKPAVASKPAANKPVRAADNGPKASAPSGGTKKISKIRGIGAF